jgi:type III pantothenate kinase
MLLAIDIGNTNIVLGVHDGNDWRHHFRIQTETGKMADEYLLLVKGLFEHAGNDLERITQVVLSSVVPSLTWTIEESLQRLVNVPIIHVSALLDLSIKIKTDHPEQVGSDLIANAHGAFERYRDACIIVDFGTALTFTAVAADGELRGASIAPGLQTAARALSLKTAQLPEVDLTMPSSAIGANTTHALQSGIVIGYCGLAKEIIGRMRAELGATVRVVATGGLARTIATHIDSIDDIDPWLTLEGLRSIAVRNSGEPHCPCH